MFIGLIFWMLTAFILESEYERMSIASTIRKIQPNDSVISDEEVFRIGQYIHRAANEAGLDPELVVVMTYGESRFDTSIVNIMQISQTWYANEKAPPYCRLARISQEASIRCGAFVLSECRKRYKKEDNKYLCWSGFHIKDKEGYLKRIKNRWNLIRN